MRQNRAWNDKCRCKYKNNPDGGKRLGCGRRSFRRNGFRYEDHGKMCGTCSKNRRCFCCDSQRKYLRLRRFLFHLCGGTPDDRLFRLQHQGLCRAVRRLLLLNWGTNPLTVAIPTGRHPHFILDMATSQVAVNKIALALKNGKSIPDNWAVGPNGEKTTDPLVAYQGGSFRSADIKAMGSSWLFLCWQLRWPAATLTAIFPRHG